MNTLIAYHKNCIDGITSATVVAKALEAQQTVHDQVFTLSVGYNEGTLELEHKLEEYAIDTLYIVDFSYKKDVLIELCNAYDIFINLFDHHATAFRDICGYEPLADSKEEGYLADINKDMAIYYHIDMMESGASLSYKMMYPDTLDIDLPQLIALVRDYDLWQFKHSITKPVNKYLKMQDKTIDNWDTLIKGCEEPEYLANIVDIGTTLLAYEDNMEDAIIKRTAASVVLGGFGGMICNAPYEFASSIGNKLAKEAPFGATYEYAKDGTITFSLRSIGDKCDVSKVAEIYGGGGHKNAAGFKATEFPF